MSTFHQSTFDFQTGFKMITSERGRNRKKGTDQGIFLTDFINFVYLCLPLSLLTGKFIEMVSRGPLYGYASHNSLDLLPQHPHKHELKNWTETNVSWVNFELLLSGT